MTYKPQVSFLGKYYSKHYFMPGFIQFIVFLNSDSVKVMYEEEEVGEAVFLEKKNGMCHKVTLRLTQLKERLWGPPYNNKAC